MKSSRRRFLKQVSVTAAGSSFIPISLKNAVAGDGIDITLPLLKPRRLQPKSKIGIIAPASFITQKELDEIIELLSSLGYEGVPAKNVLNKFGYLGGTDNDRVSDIHEMFSRNDINVILCARGGYGTPRILPYLDYKLIRKNPKIIIGYSDITSLLIAIFLKSRIVTFHGPVGISTFNDFSLKYFNEILVEGKEIVEMSSPNELPPHRNDFSSVKEVLKIIPGKVEGELIGGNLSLLITHLGTEFDFDLKDKILFIEEVGEEPYRIDRMLTQLINSGKLKECAGIALGVFSNCEQRRDNPSFETTFNLREVLIDRLSYLDIPAIYGLSFGHVKDKFTIPIGIRAMLNVDEAKLTLLEAAVS
ncbi:MAG: LD-carboxypeptidase [Ignavibacteria bacterium]|nr:LD-carboxypeptidase [Ignavibacteria bacterium]